MMTESGTVSVRVLGTGTSTGVPVIGCTCRVCTSTDSRDNRLRCSCFVQVNGLGILLDAGPDFRTQALRYEVPAIDAVLITHHHFDHVVGLDDLRPFLFRNREAIPCYAPDESAIVLRRMFAYIFDGPSYPGVPNLNLISVREPFDVAGREDPAKRFTVHPVPARHGSIDVFGYRIGNFAWLTDVSSIPETSLELLENLDVLVLDALRHDPHPKHLTFEQSISIARKIGARQTFFIHMTHGTLHAEQDALLPSGMNLAFDGLEFKASI